MTDERMALAELLEKGSDRDLLVVTSTRKRPCLDEKADAEIRIL